MNLIAICITTTLLLPMSHTIPTMERPPVMHRYVPRWGVKNYVDAKRYGKFWTSQYLRQRPIFSITLPVITERVEPIRNEKYNPNYGYEPYWHKGDWVFKTSTIHPNYTVSALCEPDCSPIYMRYGEICGQNKYLKISRTFENYCAMRGLDCLDRHGWYIVHRGKCRPPVKLYTAHYLHIHLATTTPWHVNEASRFIDEYVARYNNTQPRLVPNKK